MKKQRPTAWLVGGMAAGGAFVYGLTRLFAPLDTSRRPRRDRGDGSDVLLVRVTEHDRRYHRDDCPLLDGEMRVIPVSYALESYEPCKTCHPPGGLELTESDLAEAGLSSEDVA